MNHRLSVVPIIVLLLAAPLAMASTTAIHPRFAPAQRIAHIQARIHHLEHREVLLRTRGKTRRMQKVEMRISRLGRRLYKLHGKLETK